MRNVKAVAFYRRKQRFTGIIKTALIHDNLPIPEQAKTIYAG